MKSFLSKAGVGAASGSVDTSNHWAVIMAGSNTYSNYRHQADTHHAVKIMLENGIPRENIIHLAYDDIASSYRNPFPGQLFNKPASGAGVNVYDQSEIDYSGNQVTKENFFKVLLGDTSAPGPVLGSNSESKVFVNFADHGGAGLICTPVGDWIYADELDSTLQQMKDTGMFGELVFYLEACESGSMFPNLDASENIYALTASNATLSSWAAYCGSDAMVDGKSVGSCLGDLFSINWMEDTDSHDASIETLAQQQATIIAKTTASPVQKFGDQSFLSEPIGDFEGANNNQGGLFKKFRDLLHHTTEDYIRPLSEHFAKADPTIVDSRDHNLHYLMQQTVNDPTAENFAAVHAEVEHRNRMDIVFGAEHLQVANAPEIPQNFDCLRMMVGTVEEMCGPWSDYSLKYVRKLANICDTQTEEQVAESVSKIFEACQ